MFWLDVCGVYEAFGLVVFEAFSVFVAFNYGALGWVACGVYSVSSVSVGH